MIASGASFSYTNEHTKEERFMLKIRRNKVEDDELGVFGAEKYFKGVVDGELLRITDNGAHYGSKPPREKNEEPCPKPKPKTPSSVCSETSWNSKKGLLVNNGPNDNNHSKKTSVKSLLASLVCSCIGKSSVKITEAKQPVKGGVSGQKPKWLSSKRADEDVNVKGEDCFMFPVVNHLMADVKLPELPEVEHESEQERKLTMLTWDGLTPRAEVLDATRNGGQSDAGSDGSSDLFEIESFSTNENNLFLAQQAIEKNTYAPSDASIDWSVVTASAAESLTPKDLVPRNVKVPGILSRCKSHRAVRLSCDEHCISSGNEKAAVVPPARREWCHQLDPPTPVAKIQADTKLICTVSGLHISHNGFGVARPIHRTHSTHAS